METIDALKTSLNLVHAARNGDRKAFEEFVNRYFERVLRIVRARVGPKLRARQDSMDLAQNAIIRVIEGLERFDPESEGALINWISKLVENEIRDQVEFHDAQKRRISKEVAILPSTESRAGLEGQLGDVFQRSPSQQVALKEEILRLEKALDKLESGKEAIILREYSGLTFREIAKELNVSEDAARMQYVRAMDKLTDLIREG